jgi:hypothetical protein
MLRVFFPNVDQKIQWRKYRQGVLAHKPVITIRAGLLTRLADLQLPESAYSTIYGPEEARNQLLRRCKVVVMSCGSKLPRLPA